MKLNATTRRTIAARLKAVIDTLAAGVPITTQQMDVLSSVHAALDPPKTEVGKCVDYTREARDEYIVGAYSNGDSVRTIAARLGLSHTAVHNVVAKAGLQRVNTDPLAAIIYDEFASGTTVRLIAHFRQMEPRTIRNMIRREAARRGQPAPEF